MSDFKERLLTENDELAGRIMKLDGFLNGNNVMNDIDPVQIDLLHIQLRAMRTYHQCLLVRIDRLK